MRLSASYFPSRAESLVLHSGLVQTILTTLVAILVTWAVTSFLQRKRIAWRDYLDAPVNLDPKEASRVSSWKILCEDREVTDPSLVLLRIRNAGIVDITDGDFTSTLEFSFDGRQIRGSDVIECNGESEYKVLPLENRNKAVGCDRIKLAEFSMNRGDRSRTRRAFQQKILLGRPEMAPTSHDCVHQDVGAASPVISCQVGTTMALLQNVARIPGAIGYAQAADATASRNANIQLVPDRRPRRRSRGHRKRPGQVPLLDGRVPLQLRHTTGQLARGRIPRLPEQLRRQGHPARPGL